MINESYREWFLLTDNGLEKEKTSMTPDKGFNLVGIDYLTDSAGQLYLIEHFERYQDALNAKKSKKNPDEYMILYKGAGDQYLSR